MTSIYDIHEAARDCDVEGLAPAPKYQAISDMHWMHLLVPTAIQMLMAKSSFCIFKR